ncbi:MAG: hypothetical protein WBF58_14340 [Xanthobacteraceae bacterium]
MPDGQIEPGAGGGGGGGGGGGPHDPFGGCGAWPDGQHDGGLVAKFGICPTGQQIDGARTSPRLQGEVTRQAPPDGNDPIQGQQPPPGSCGIPAHLPLLEGKIGQ